MEPRPTRHEPSSRNWRRAAVPALLAASSVLLVGAAPQSTEATPRGKTVNTPTTSTPETLEHTVPAAVTPKPASYPAGTGNPGPADSSREPIVDNCGLNITGDTDPVGRYLGDSSTCTTAGA